MNNFVYYCKDFEKYGNRQEWNKSFNNFDIKFIAKRQAYDSWKVGFEFKTNFYSISFNTKTDYNPTKDVAHTSQLYKNRFEESINKEKLIYWTFPEAQFEIEKMAHMISSVKFASS